MTYKICTLCKTTKELSAFAPKKNKSGSITLRSACRPCEVLRNKNRRLIEDQDTRQSRISKNKEWRLANMPLVRALKAKYRMRDKIVKLSSIHHDAHVIKYNQYMHKVNTTVYDAHVRLWKSNRTLQAAWNQKHDMSYVVFNRLKRGVQRCFAKKGNIDTKGWFGLLGYTSRELKKHIEDKFVSGMDWDNRDEWHIDHVNPLCMYDMQSIHDAEFKECFSLNNLRPMWADHNRVKYNCYDKLLNIKNKRVPLQSVARGE